MAEKDSNMNPDAEGGAHTHAPWQREFFKNIEGFIKYGVPEERAKEILTKFLKLSVSTPLPDVTKTFQNPDLLDEVGVHTRQDPALRDFMVEFLTPLMRNFTFEGRENIQYIQPLLGKFPVTLISNHMSHLDAPAIYNMLYNEGGDARMIADQLVSIAGRLAFEPDFARLALYMFDTLLVCSKLDMSDNPGLADLMTRINMRAFRQSQQLQKEGRIMSIFPEGTRSRTGRLISFVDTVYHYVANKIIIPVTLEGTDNILPTSSFLFNAAKGKMALGRPILVGKLSAKQMEELPDFVDRLDVPETADKKQYIIDNLATIVGQNLHKHRHGTYRNLYVADDPRNKENRLIQRSTKPAHKVVVIGHSPYGTAIASVLANKDADILIYTDDAEKAQEYNARRVDGANFPLLKLPPNISFTSNPVDVEQGTLFVQAARPWELDKYYSRLKLYLEKGDAPIISVVKGFTGSEKGLILDDLANEYDIDPARHVVMAGANYPEQIMERKISGYEMAANRVELVNELTQLFSTGYVFVRPAVNPSDVRGVQLGGALKNIYALATGLLDGYYESSLGGNCDNSLFHVSNRFFREMTAIGTAMGGQAETFGGLSGLTDLMLACFGADARDRQYAHDFVKGKADPNHKSNGVFGVRSLPNLINLNPDDYPVAFAVHAVMVKGMEGEKVLESIMYSLRKF